MARIDFSSTQTGDPAQTLSVISTPAQDTDSPTSGELEYNSPKWKEYNGYYRKYPLVQAVVDKMALWTVGKGFNANDATKKRLEKIKGFGKDTFNNILENMIRIYLINGDSFAEIVKDKRGRTINIKPLNPGRIKIITNGSGIITRYEQTNGKEDGKTIERFDPEEILHLCWNREADEIHGISILESLIKTLNYGKQLDEDMTKVFHRYVMPLLIVEADTDDSTELTTLKNSVDKAQREARNLVITKDATSLEPMAIPQFSSLDPLKWKLTWNQDVIASVGVPELVLGRATDITEASAKMVYLAFQQTIERNQRFVEAQLKAQLGIEIELEFPARIEENLGEDEGKDGNINTGKKSEVTINTKKVDGNNVKAPK